MMRGGGSSCGAGVGAGDGEASGAGVVAGVGEACGAGATLEADATSRRTEAAHARARMRNHRSIRLSRILDLLRRTPEAWGPLAEIFQARAGVEDHDPVARRYR